MTILSNARDARIDAIANWVRKREEALAVNATHSAGAGASRILADPRTTSGMLPGDALGGERQPEALISQRRIDAFIRRLNRFSAAAQNAGVKDQIRISRPHRTAASENESIEGRVAPWEMPALRRSS